jgi:acid phosphatase family membrane protein YuiD
MIWAQLISNRVLVAGLIAWMLAQFFKVPIQYLLHRKIDWGMWISTGGMPSSHSALVTATMLAIGLYTGFNTPAFALSVAVTMVVIYDAAGVRRQAGKHAERINMIIDELFTGQPISEENLKEVLGHTPVEVIGGVILGFIVSISVWQFWH